MKRTIATVAKPMFLKTQEIDEQINIALEVTTEITNKAYLLGYKQALINLDQLLTSDADKESISKAVKNVIKEYEEKEDENNI